MIELRGVHQPRLNDRRLELIDVRPGEPSDCGSTKRDKIAFRTEIRQTHGGHKFRKLAREEWIATAAANDLHDCVTAFPRNLDVGLVGRIQRLGDGGVPAPRPRASRRA